MFFPRLFPKHQLKGLEHLIFTVSLQHHRKLSNLLALPTARDLFLPPSHHPELDRILHILQSHPAQLIAALASLACALVAAYLLVGHGLAAEVADDMIIVIEYLENDLRGLLEVGRQGHKVHRGERRVRLD